MRKVDLIIGAISLIGLLTVFLVDPLTNGQPGPTWNNATDTDSFGFIFFFPIILLADIVTLRGKLPAVFLYSFGLIYFASAFIVYKINKRDAKLLERLAQKARDN